MFFFFFSIDAATTAIYTLSLHDALPISLAALAQKIRNADRPIRRCRRRHTHAAQGAKRPGGTDRKSTRLNSSHSQISYAVFCLKKKNNIEEEKVSKVRIASMQSLYKKFF